MTIVPKNVCHALQEHKKIGKFGILKLGLRSFSSNMISTYLYNTFIRYKFSLEVYKEQHQFITWHKNYDKYVSLEMCRDTIYRDDWK